MSLQEPAATVGDDRVTIDVCAYDDNTIVDALSLASLDVEPFPPLGRWRRFAFVVPATVPVPRADELPASSVMAAAEEVDAGVLPVLDFELPRVPDSLLGRKSRYFYARRHHEVVKVCCAGQHVRDEETAA
jgi:hypothetical protein